MEGIGASDASCIMGENKFKSARALLYEKRARIKPSVNAAMAEGTRLEASARRSYEQRQSIRVEPLCIESTEHNWLRASLDGINAERDMIVEIKCGKSAFKQARLRRIPSYYYGQLQHQLMVSGLLSIDYWCYRREVGGVLLRMERNERYIKGLLQREKEFYQLMVKP